MKKLLLITAFALILGGCNNPLKKSVFEPLTIKELKVTMVKDSVFGEAYTNIRRFTDDRTDVEIAKYYDITYKRVMDFAHYSESEDYEKEIELFKNEWNEKHSESEKYFDSIVSGKIKIDLGGHNVALKRNIKNINNSSFSSDLKSRLRKNLFSLLEMDYFDDEDRFVQNKMDLIRKSKDKLLFDFLESIK